MTRRLAKIFAGWDWILLAASLILILVGLASHYASALGEGIPLGDSIFAKQAVAAAIGLVALLIASQVDFNVYRSWARLLYVFMILILGTVLIFGEQVRGTRGWFLLGGLSFQPVELAKLLFIISLAAYLAYLGPPLNFKKTLGSSLILLPPLLLVLWQPDFGSAALLALIFLAMLATVPKRRRWWLWAGALIIVVMSLTWLGLKDYQKSRLQVFLNPHLNPLGTGYNVTQSVIAVGSGQWLGRGLGLGTQSQLDFLPEQQTDFIFASVAEELGLVGAGLVLVLFGVWFARVIRLMRRLRDDFSLLVTGGIAGIVFIQVALNISMNMGMAPVIGLPLPFLSSGGSSLVITMLAVGMLENLARHYSGQAPFAVNY
ncbi:TPA: rod shape-determining protein RodA [Patescibacteria group bacterium]|nr:MAG: Rod shape-determining protein RodA [Parcubacteria group bacterium GW2011_GWA2_46_39]HBV33474.1 rod shape-determining protein RodA [Patescibacteria group bacterium]HCU47548.1 rod shape-determining protein RodA [Patescibacteria group bacterium]